MNFVYYGYADDGRLLYRSRTRWWPRVASVAYEQEHAAIERRRRARAQLREVERLLRAVGDIPRKPRTIAP